MSIVALIPTGKLEHLALRDSLRQIFPAVEFQVLPPDRHLDGFTSTDVTTHNRPPEKASNVRQLVATMIAAVLPGGPRPRADFSFLIEDLELVNDGQPAAVVDLVREAVVRHVQDSFPSEARRLAVFNEIQEKCSFHLFRPMTEAYFFGDPLALGRAGATRPAQLRPDRDWEQFETVDPEYLALPDGQFSRSPFGIPDHLTQPAFRSFHPKGYLRYLVNPELAERGPRYRETHEGRAALAGLNWQQVIETGADRSPFLHAFLEDLAYALEVQLPWLDPSRTAELTRFATPARDRRLRNI